MSHDCPDCGSAFELEERTAKVRVGTCPGCHRSFTLIPHATNAPGEAGKEAAPDVVVGTLATGPPEGEGDAPESPDADEEDDEDDDSETPVCGTCGSDLVFKAADEVTIEVFCPQCNETTRFKAEGAEAEAEPSEAPRPPPREDRRERPPMDRERRYDRMGPPPAKGCRRCGGTIDFQPLPDGGREGVCRNCGNRFRLPPRRDDDRGGGGGGRRYEGGGRGGGGYRPGGRRGPPRGGGSRYRDEDRDERPRYRRD
ncbi:MAG TPA: hypothetical protein VMH90_00890 [Thermoplasmata archaeon]|nr:hypothetical protein [Thermoplasmata archaeon]